MEIIFEDNHILVVFKPAGIATQEDSSGDLSLQQKLKQYLVEKNAKPGRAYLGIVHRLDRPTAGVMVFAKTSKAAARLSAAIADSGKLTQDSQYAVSARPAGEPVFEKTYFAVVQGILKEREGTLTDYLRKNEIKNKVEITGMATEGAKLAVLEYKVIEEITNVSLPSSLVRVNLLTGRPHQIRVQFSHAGHPVLGDIKYGASQKTAGLDLALFAVELKLTHPTTKEKMVFRAYPPKAPPWKAFDLSRHLAL